MKARYENSIRILSDDSEAVEDRILAAEDLSNACGQAVVDTLSAVAARPATPPELLSAIKGSLKTF